MAVIKQFVVNSQSRPIAPKGSMPDASYYIKRAAPTVASYQKIRNDQAKSEKASRRAYAVQAAQSEADKYQQEAEQASSFKGMATNALKAAPQAIADVLVGTPAKFAVSAYEAPKLAVDNLSGAKPGYTNKTYKVPGLSPFKSFQSDFGDVSNDVISGKRGLAAAAWELAKVPLAGAETLGIGKGLGRAAGAARVGDIKGSAVNVVDAFLPTTRSFKTPEDVAKLPESQGKILSTPRKLITSGGRVLQESGTGGQELNKIIRNQQTEGDLLTGQYNQRISDALSTLSKENIVNKVGNQVGIESQRAKELQNLTDVLEGKAQPLHEGVAEAAKKMRAFYDDIAKEAQKREFEIRTPDGQSVPFTPRENYAPRIYNWDEFTKGKRREEALQHMVDTGQARNRAEAAKALDTFIKENAQRRAGNLENARMFDVPGYEKDAETAARMYAQKTAGRFTQADNFGKKDEIAAALIDKIANEGGDYADAQKVFDSIYKGDARNKTIDAVLKFNTLTKLSLSFLSNLTQSVNTATKGGVGNTAKAIVQSFTKSGKDLAELAGVYTDPIIMQETGINMGKLLGVTMKPFQWVESFNRRVAANAGANFAKELAKTLEKNPDSAFALRQLSSLGISPDKIVKGTLSGDDVLRAANEFTRKTQFVSDALNVPTAWKTPTGKLLTQFKNFSFMQTQFIRDEIAKEAIKGNLKPLVTFLTLAPAASFASQSLRNEINAVDPSNEKANPSFRKLDLYRKAIGDIPTDIISQLQYAYEKSQSPYTTPLTNVKNFSSIITGPTGGDIMSLMSALEQQGNIKEQNRNWYAEHPAAQKDPYLDLKRFGAGKIPFVGRRIVNSQLAYGPTDAEKAKKMAKEALNKGDYNGVIEAIKLDPYLNNQTVIKNLMKESQIESMSQADQELYKQIQEMKKRPVKPFYIP